MPNKVKSKPKVPKHGPIEVGVSTLHGILLPIQVDPTQTIEEVKQAIQQSILASPSASDIASHEELGDDMLELMHGCAPEDVNFRLCTWDGTMLQDKMTFQAQMTRKEIAESFFKVVWMKQHNFSARDRQILHFFHDNPRAAHVSIPMTNGTEFYVRPVFGGQGRLNDMLGLVFNHRDTEAHCMVKGKYKLNPLTVDWDNPGEMRFDLPRGLVIGDWAEPSAWMDEDIRRSPS